MLTDVTTIIWKEAKELFLQAPKFRGGWLGMLVFLGVFGVYLPLQSGAEWVNSSMNLVMWAWLPYLLVNSIVADSFAGERERHTLETLLASRLSDRAILIGKIAASLLYGWGITLAAVLVGLITVNVAHGESRLLLFPAPLFAGILVITLLIAALSAGLGVVVSLRASTVRQAQQTLSFGFFLFFIPVLIFPMLPSDMQNQVIRLLSGSNPTSMVIAISVGLVVVDLVLFALAAIRFRRSRLILD